MWESDVACEGVTRPIRTLDYWLHLEKLMGEAFAVHQFPKETTAITEPKMAHSERDLARKVATRLAASGEAVFRSAPREVETDLTGSADPRAKYFDVSTIVSVGGLIVQVATLAITIWKESAARNKAAMEQGAKEDIKEQLRNKLESASIEVAIRDRVISQTLIILETEGVD
jgi:hypothetical protein